MTSPYPGVAVPSPRTWSAGDIITAARLRGDITGLAEIFCGGRPMLAAQLGQGSGGDVPAGPPAPLIVMSSAGLNTWNVPVLTGSKLNPYYTVPLTGWYLVQTSILWDLEAALSEYKFGVGIQFTQNGTANRVDGGAVTSSTATLAFPGSAGADLALLDASTSDTIAVYAFQNTTTTQILDSATLTVEWAGASAGTVVSSGLPAPASWPAGMGTYITGGDIGTGATSVTVNDATGIVAGATLGLDYQAGTLTQPYAETVTVSSVSGTTITISATAYAHSQGAPVAVPVSYAFLNEQVRDIVNFLAYPPLLRAAAASTAQSVPSQTFPAGTAITGLSAASPGIDNFSGLSASVYTAPVAGIYLLYGQVYLTGSTSAFISAAGYQVNTGTVQWGTGFRTFTSSAAQSVCPWFTRQVRLNAGDTVTLYGFQSSGSAMDTVATATSNSRLIAVWRAT